MKNRHYFDPLVEAFNRKEVILFLGPFFAVANVYPAIRNFLTETKNRSLNAIPKGSELGRQELHRMAKACSMLWKRKLNPGRYPPHDKQKRHPNPLYCLATGWPVKLNITGDFDLRLKDFFHIPSYASPLDKVWQADLATFLEGDAYILHSFGSASNPESMEEGISKFEKIDQDDVLKDYFAALFQKFSPLFVGFEPDDPIFRKLLAVRGSEVRGEQKTCMEQAPEAKPWYAFFTSPIEESPNPGIDLRVISSGHTNPLPDVNERQDMNLGFFIALLSKMKLET